jgi:hypothetical protein
VEVATGFGDVVTGSIVGGTGAYNGARGTFTSRERRPTVDTFEVLPYIGPHARPTASSTATGGPVAEPTLAMRVS